MTRPMTDTRTLRERVDALTPEESAALVAAFKERLAEGRRMHDEGRVTSRATMLVPGYLPDDEDDNNPSPELGEGN